MSSIVDSWALSLRAEGRAPKTVRLYVSAATSLESVTGKDARQVTASDLRVWLLDRQAVWSPTTVSINYRAIKVLFRWLVDEEEITKSPTLRVKVPSVPDSIPRTATADDVTRLVAAIPTKIRDGRRFTDVRDLALILVLADSGVRRGELLGMRRSDVNLSVGVARVNGKTGPRVVPLSARAIEALDRLQRRDRDAPDDAPLWQSQRGCALGETGLKLLLERRCQRAGIDRLNPHSFRHGMAHRWLEAGGSELGLQDVAGWRSAAMLRVYGRGQRQGRAALEFRRVIDG